MLEIEIKEKARRLIVFEGKTQEEAAEILKISARTLANWAAFGNWLDKRKEYLEITDSLDLATLQLIKATTDKALKTLETQDIYAVIQLHICIGNSYNQLHYLRPFIIKDLIEIKKRSINEVSEILGLSVNRVRKLYKKATSPKIAADNNDENSPDNKEL
jgi:hypothetical protein